MILIPLPGRLREGHSWRSSGARRRTGRTGRTGLERQFAFLSPAGSLKPNSIFPGPDERQKFGPDWIVGSTVGPLMYYGLSVPWRGGGFNHPRGVYRFQGEGLQRGPSGTIDFLHFCIENVKKKCLCFFPHGFDIFLDRLGSWKNL